MLFNWKLKILSSVVAVAMLFTVCPSTTFATKTWLHEVLEDEKHAPSVEEVERIVTKHPEWLNEEDNDGRTPVKIAGDKGLSEIATFLSGFVPPSSGPDYYAKKMAAIFTKPTWLHEVLEEEGVPIDEFKHIVDKHPEWLSKKDDKGRTPGEIAIAKMGPHSDIALILNAPELSPSAFSEKIERLQRRYESLQAEMTKLRDQLVALKEQAGAITGGTIDSAAITGGTVSGLAKPLAVADGGTGLNALGTANYSLAVKGAGDGLTWSLNDRLDNKHFAIAADTDLNRILTPGTYCCESGTTTDTLTNKPVDMNNSAFLMIVRYITANYWQQEIINNENKRWSRQCRKDTFTWSDWSPNRNVAFCIGFKSGNPLKVPADSSYHKVALDHLFFNTAGGTFASNGYKLPYTGNWLFILKCVWWSNRAETKYCEIAKGSTLTQLEFGCHYFAITGEKKDYTTTTVTALATCNKDDEIYMAANNMTTNGGIRIVEGTCLQGIYLGV